MPRGQGAPELRRQYETPATRQATFEQQWAQSYPGVKSTELNVSDTKNLELPVTLKFGIDMPRYAESGPGLLRFFPFGAGRAFTQALAPLSERTEDLVLPGVWVNELETTYTLPPSWVVNELPPEQLEESPFGSLRINAVRDGAKLKVTGRLVLSRARIGKAEYPAFRAWLLKVDQAFSRKLVVQAGGQTASR